MVKYILVKEPKKDSESLKDYTGTNFASFIINTRIKRFYNSLTGNHFLITLI